MVNKYNNTVHKTIKMKPVNVTDDSYVEYNEDFDKKDPKFRVGDHVKAAKYKSIFRKDILQIGRKKFSLLVKLKMQFLGHRQLMTWMIKILQEVFMKKNCKKLVKKNLE